MTADLFDDASGELRLGPHAILLKGFALAESQQLLEDIHAIAQQAPWRHMQTPGGKSMSVANSNCGDLGWVSDLRGYRYVREDPLTGRAWPAIPERWLALAERAKQRAGFPVGTPPDACLLNRYAPGARLSLHQDRDERDFFAPIISISLGLPAVFLWGGHARGDPWRRVPLAQGDVVIWGGDDRPRFHGVGPVEGAMTQDAPAFRYNITMRRAG